MVTGTHYPSEDLTKKSFNTREREKERERRVGEGKRERERKGENNKLLKESWKILRM